MKDEIYQKVAVLAVSALHTEHLAVSCAAVLGRGKALQGDKKALWKLKSGFKNMEKCRGVADFIFIPCSTAGCSSGPVSAGD